MTVVVLFLRWDSVFQAFDHWLESSDETLKSDAIGPQAGLASHMIRPD